MTHLKTPALSRRHLLVAAGAAAGLAASGFTAPAQARAPQLGTAVPGWYRFRIGDIEATIISDGLLNLGAADAQFPAAPKDDIARIRAEEFLPLSPMMLEQNALVLNIGERLVLFDSGMGSDQMFGDKSGRLLRNLAAAGIQPDQIDDIVLTHAHCDHCWGMVGDGGALNFPNAQVHMSQADFDFWTDEAKLSGAGFLPAFVKGARKNLLPYRDRMHFVADQKEVLPGITALSTPGHTVGHTSFLISSGNESFLNVGDVVHHYALLFENPTWEFAFDSSPSQAAQTRVKLFDMAAADQMRMIGYHFPFPGLGHIRREGSAFEYVAIPMMHG
jgi:glyoxylase-like metal-dependent hydrolase (beta-lactamase superfamily II)